MSPVHFPWPCHALRGPIVEKMLYVSDTMRRFAGAEDGDDRVPDATTVPTFRRMPETHPLTGTPFLDHGCGSADVRMPWVPGQGAPAIAAPRSVPPSAQQVPQERTR
jgi:hypothetical protein